MIVSTIDQDNYQQSLQQLYNLLNQECGNASSIPAQDAINDLSQVVFGILTTLNQGALDTNTAQYVKLKADVTAANTKLQNARKQINNWINAISIATQVTGAIDQAINLAAKVFAV